MGHDGGEMIVNVKNRFGIGDEIELMTPSRNVVFTLNELYSDTGQAIDVAPGSGHVARLPIPDELLGSISDHDVQFGMLMRTVA